MNELTSQLGMCPLAQESQNNYDSKYGKLEAITKWRHSQHYDLYQIKLLKKTKWLRVGIPIIQLKPNIHIEINFYIIFYILTDQKILLIKIINYHNFT